MPIDPNIFSAYAQRPVNPLDVQNELIQNQDNRLLLKQKQALVADQARQQQEAGVIRNALMTAKPDVQSRANALEATGLQSAYVMADKLRTNASSQAKEAAETNQKITETGIKKLDVIYSKALPNITSRDQYAKLMQVVYSDPDLKGLAAGGGTLEDAVSRFPDDPAKVPEFINKNAMGIKDFVANQTTIRGQDSTRQTALDTTTMSQAGADRRNQATITAENARAAASRTQSASQFATTQAAGKVPSGYRANPDGSWSFIPGGPADPARNGEKQPSEGERKAATLLTRLEGSQAQLAKAVTQDASAASPSAMAEMARKAGGDTAANLANSGTRRRVEAAQLDMLDAALTLGTGAAYTKEQLEGYRRSYFPQIGDDANDIADKKQRLETVIKAAKIAAGRSASAVPDVNSGAPAKPKFGAVVDGYRYKGGDPASQSSWTKVSP